MSEFEQYAEAIKKRDDLVNSLSDAEKLEIYALFKQGTIGDCNTASPWTIDFKNKAKWDAWNSKKGLSQEDAKQAYVDLLKEHGVTI